MNTRKNIDYSEMYAALDTVMAAEMSQMELYSEIGKVVSRRSEKGAAVSDPPDIVLRFIIPKEVKKQLLADLSILGVSEDYLFGDSIDLVCKGIVDSLKKKCR